MKLICTKDKSHNEFNSIAHVTQLWKLDNQGIFLDTLADIVEVTHEPNAENNFQCDICGSDVIIEA